MRVIGILCFFRRVRWCVSNQQGYMFWRARFVFPLGLAVLVFGSFLFVPNFLGGECVFFLRLLFCRFFQLYYVVGSPGRGSPGIQCFTIPCEFSSGCSVGQQSTKYLLQVFFFLQQMEVLGTRTWLDSFSHFSVSLRYLSASFNDRGQDSISPGVSSSQHQLVSPSRQRAVSL